MFTAVALSAIALLVPTSAAATPPAPNTVASVTAQLKTISQQNEALSEQLNLVIADVAAKQDALTAAQAAAKTASDNYLSQRALLTATLQAQYEGGANFSRTGALLNSQSSKNYADKISTLNMMSVHRGDVVAQVTAAKSAATAAQTTADGLLKDASAKRDDLTRQQTALAADKKKYDVLLATLTAQEQAAYHSVGTPAIAVDTVSLQVHAGPAAAQIAVNFALAQVGKPYVYAASGPGAYDCSGLTAAAWAAAGVKLPHNAAAQYNYGTHVAESDLQPGDLLMMYHPISHVTIYIGNGLMVSAPQPGENVKVVTVASQQNIYVGAVRLV